jgi:hypothetical protein
MLEVELLTLDPKTFDNLQDFFTKYKDLLLQLKACRVDKSKGGEKNGSYHSLQTWFRILNVCIHISLS